MVSSVESGRTIAEAVQALSASCAGLQHEILVMDASHDRSAELAERSGSACAVRRFAPGTLAPELWAEGIRLSRGRVVALTTGHCIVPRPWARVLLEAVLDPAVAGAGSGLLPARDLSAVDCAVFYLRYSAFLDLTSGGNRPVREIPGDNAAYRGDALRGYVRGRTGFWEVEYHREIRSRGEVLLAVPAASVAFGRSFPFEVILRHRFDHGRHFGEWRVREGGESRWRVLAAVPLVPMVLLGRSARRALRRPGHRLGFAAASAPLLGLAAAWAMGEGVGALRADRIAPAPLGSAS